MVVDRISDLTGELIIGGCGTSFIAGIGTGVCYVHQIPPESLIYLIGAVPGIAGLVQGVSATRDLVNTAEQYDEDISEQSILKEGALMSIGMMGMVTGPGYIFGLGLGILAGLATGGYRNWI